MATEAPTEVRTLRRALKMRHLIMLSVGGTIASGFLLASGGAIALAGPGVVITYLIAGLVAIGVMACLSELSVQGQTAGGFAKYAETSIGPLVGFLTGSNYWLAWIGGSAAEAVAVGTFAQALPPFHSTPVWLIAFVVITVDIAINLVGVLLMGNYEFALSTIKIVALAVFVIFCIGAMLGIGSPASGTSNFTSHGGFLPFGVAGLFTSFLLVFYAYTGIEMISVTAEESVHPEKDIPRALMGTAALVTVIFMAAILAMVAVVSWKTLGTSSSPLVDALNAIHAPIFANLMTLAIIIGSISAIDCGIYSGSRVVFALARDSYLPDRLAVTNSKTDVPTVALIVSALFIYTGVVVDLLSPKIAYVFLGSLATLGFLWAWTIIPVMQILFRRRLGAEGARNLKWRMPLYPAIPIACIALVGLAIIAPIFQNTPGLFGINAGALPVVAGAIYMAAWTAYYFLYAKPHRLAAAARLASADVPA